MRGRCDRHPGRIGDPFHVDLTELDAAVTNGTTVDTTAWSADNATNSVARPAATRLPRRAAAWVHGASCPPRPRRVARAVVLGRLRRPAGRARPRRPRGAAARPRRPAGADPAPAARLRRGRAAGGG